MTDDRLSADELTNLVRRVFEPTAADRALAVIVDLPDDQTPDTEAWKIRRRLAAGWVEELGEAQGMTTASRSRSFSIPTSTRTTPICRRSRGGGPGRNPPITWTPWPVTLEEPMEGVLASHQIVIAPTEFSTTAPLKVMAPRLGFRAATMPGFSPAMVPALRLGLHRGQPPRHAPQKSPRRQRRRRFSLRGRRLERTPAPPRPSPPHGPRLGRPAAEDRAPRATSPRARPISFPTRVRSPDDPTSSHGKSPGSVRRRGGGIRDRKQRRDRHHEQRPGVGRRATPPHVRTGTRQHRRTRVGRALRLRRQTHRRRAARRKARSPPRLRPQRTLRRPGRPVRLLAPRGGDAPGPRLPAGTPATGARG